MDLVFRLISKWVAVHALRCSVLHLLSDGSIIHEKALDTNLHSPERQLIELRMEHADLDAMVDRLATELPVDELMLRRIKKRPLALRDQIASLERQLEPQEPA